MDRNQAEEIRRSADQFTEAVRELSRSVDRLVEHERVLERVYLFWEDLEEALRQQQGEPALRWHIRPPRRRLAEKEAASLAVEAVREVRQELWRGREPEAPAPTPEEIEKWEWDREQRRKREGYEVP